MASVDQREYCKLCDKWFGNWDAFIIHKIRSKAHIACFVCGRDFKTQEGCTKHQRQEHAAEQELSCVECEAKFTRVGAYISHIEQRMCRNISKKDFDDRRDEKDQWYKTTKHGDQMGEEPNFEMDRSIKPIYENNGSWESWGTKTSPSFDMFKDFPVLPHSNCRNSGNKIPDLLTSAPEKADPSKSKWFNNENHGKALFPDALNAVEAPAKLLAALDLNQSVKRDESRLPPECDPDHPDFNPAVLYNPFSEKYRCPWPGCKKTQYHVQGLKQHLRSPAHMNERLQCPGCLRIYNSATALVQHAESQAVKCNIRDSAKYRQAVDQITGGLIDAVGRHEDDTIKYVTPQQTMLISVEDTEIRNWAREDEERMTLLKNQEENAVGMKW